MSFQELRTVNDMRLIDADEMEVKEDGMYENWID